jgi:hypothetical protein
METTEEILLEEGDDARTIRREIYANIAEDMAERIEPIAAGYRKIKDKKKGPAGSGQNPQRTHELLREASAESAQAHTEVRGAATQQPTLLEGPIELAKSREPGRDTPVYNEEGKRIRGVGQKSFIQREINAAWQALSEAKLIDSAPDSSKAGNPMRKDIRQWLLQTPLDPKFSEQELGMTIESYSKWRGQGFTTAEAMTEVGNDYAGHYSGKPGGADQEAEASEDETESGDQDAGDGGSLDEPGGVDAGPDDGTAKVDPFTEA